MNAVVFLTTAACGWDRLYARLVAETFAPRFSGRVRVVTRDERSVRVFERLVEPTNVEVVLDGDGAWARSLFVEARRDGLCLPAFVVYEAETRVLFFWKAFEAPATLGGAKNRPLPADVLARLTDGGALVREVDGAHVLMEMEDSALYAELRAEAAERFGAMGVRALERDLTCFCERTVRVSASRSSWLTRLDTTTDWKAAPPRAAAPTPTHALPPPASPCLDADSMLCSPLAPVVRRLSLQQARAFVGGGSSSSSKRGAWRMSARRRQRQQAPTPPPPELARLRGPLAHEAERSAVLHGRRLGDTRNLKNDDDDDGGRRGRRRVQPRAVAEAALDKLQRMTK